MGALYNINYTMYYVINLINDQNYVLFLLIIILFLLIILLYYFNLI